MQIEVVKIGKPAFGAYEPLVQEYAKRLQPFCKSVNSILKESEAARRFGPKNAKNRPFLVLLDEKGKGLSSIDFSKKMSDWIDNPAINEVTIVIGPPFGLSEALKKQAAATIALSSLTFTSDMAWLLIWEQLYRASQIIQGTGYHHE